MNNKSIKFTITEAVSQQLPNEDTSVEKLISDWWFTKSGSSLRLSQIGDMKFREAEIEFFDLPLNVTNDSWYGFIVDCGKKLKCPFYIGTKKNKGPDGPFIRLYDGKIAMMMALYGDIHGYLESVQTRK